MGYLEDTNTAFLFSFQLKKDVHYNLKPRKWGETDNCYDYMLKKFHTISWWGFSFGEILNYWNLDRILTDIDCPISEEKQQPERVMPPSIKAVPVEQTRQER